MYVLKSVSILKDTLGFYQSFLRKLSIKTEARTAYKILNSDLKGWYDVT